VKTEPGKYRVEIYNTDRDMSDTSTVTLSLIIMVVTKQDFGTYVCEASSVLGRDAENMVLFGECLFRWLLTPEMGCDRDVDSIQLDLRFQCLWLVSLILLTSCVYDCGVCLGFSLNVCGTLYVSVCVSLCCLI
jgi:hypothetical protein